MVVAVLIAVLTTTLLILDLPPEIWKGLSERWILPLVAMGFSLTAIVVMLAIGGASLGWTGFGDKTLWDWLQLLSALAIPVVLATAGLWFTAQQDQLQQQTENKRAAAERELADQRAQDEALQAYLDQMGGLLLERDLRASEKGTEVRTLARARTLTVLERLDGDRKRSVVQFLYEAGLLTEGQVVVDLKGADLSEANLDGANLRDANLREANLSNAHLDGANLHKANLHKANLSNAHLREAALHDADLSNAYLSNADLSNAYLRRADLIGAFLRDADLSGAFLKDANLKDANLREANLRDADLREADLSGARLSEAVLRDADLIRADLEGANLGDADLSGAFLRDANLSNAVRWTEKQLTAAAGLAGTTMPNGQKYKDWLKDPGQLPTTKFEPALSYNISGGWKLTTETTDVLLLEGPERGQLIFTSPSHVFDPSSPSEPTKISAPENAKEWLSWFQRHPNLETSKPVPVSVGGASGMQIDVTASTPENYPRKVCSGEPCVPLYPTNGAPIGVFPDVGGKDRYVIVDVGGQTVIINVTAPAGKFDAFSPKAQKVLDTVEWKSE